MRGQKSNILKSLLNSKRFSQGFLKAKNAPQVSQLDTPVTLARTRLLPDDDAGFDRRVRVYARAWAKVDPMTRKLVAGQTAGVEVTHTIVFRHDPSYSLDARDMIFADGEIYVVRDHRIGRRDYPFTHVFATHAGSMADHDLTLVEIGDEEVVPIPEPESDPDAATDFPEWV